MKDVDARVAQSVDVLRDAGAKFAYLHGSRAAGNARPESDIDIAAYFGDNPPQSFDILLPPAVDLLVLDSAALELAGRVAVHGQLLFEVDPTARVLWESTTRKIYFDELSRITRAHKEFAESLRRGRYRARAAAPQNTAPGPNVALSAKYAFVTGIKACVDVADASGCKRPGAPRPT